MRIREASIPAIFPGSPRGGVGSAAPFAGAAQPVNAQKTSRKILLDFIRVALRQSLELVDHERHPQHRREEIYKRDRRQECNKEPTGENCQRMSAAQGSRGFPGNVAEGGELEIFPAQEPSANQERQKRPDSGQQEIERQKENAKNQSPAEEP